MKASSTRITAIFTLTALLAGTAIASAQTYRNPNPYYGSGLRSGMPQPAYPAPYGAPYGTYDGSGNPSAGQGSVNPGSQNSGPDTAG